MRWHSDAGSVAVPRSSVAGGTIQTTTRESPVGCDRTGPFDGFAFAAIGAETEAVLAGHIGAGSFSGRLGTVGVITPDRVLSQGAVSGIVRVEPAAGS